MAFFIPDGDRFVATPHGQGPWSTHHLHRHPGDEWVCPEAVAAPEPNGIGLSTSHLFDRRGPIGVAVQGLLLARP